MMDIKCISDKSMIKILKNKYNIDYNDWGSDDVKDIAIFKNWLRLFDALFDLANKAVNGSSLNESDFQTAPILQNMFESIRDEHRGIFDYPYEIRFDLFHVFKQSLELYDQQVNYFGCNKFLKTLSHHAEYGKKFPADACVRFYSIFKQQLDLSGFESDYVLMNRRRLVASQSEIYELYKRYGSLSTINVMYQLKLTKDQSKQSHVFRLIEQQIVSDDRLLKVLFKFEDDGQQGCFLNCILIYASQALLNINKCISQLELLSEMYINNIEIKFRNWGSELSRISGEDVVGLINSIGKLEIFLYWTVGSFYRHDDFFDYCPPALLDSGFTHEQVLKPWVLSLRSPPVGIRHRLVNISQAELMSFITNAEDVWSTRVLPKASQKQLMIDRVVLSEISYEFGHIENLNGEILYLLQVFDKFLNCSKEPFFYFDQSKGFISSMRPSGLGRQLIYLINLFSQNPHLLNEIRALVFILKWNQSSLLDSALWANVDVLAKKGSIVLSSVETLKNLNNVCGSYRSDQLSAKLSKLSFYEAENLSLFHRRHKDAGKYVEELLKMDQFICRFKFYADIEGESFLDQKEAFAKHFTEFLRIHKRSGLLKILNGYLLVWGVEIHEDLYEIEKMKKPFVDILFMIEPHYDFDIQYFFEKLHTEWHDYKGKKYASTEVNILFKTRDLICEVVMYSEEFLNSRFIHFEKKNRKLKKLLLEKLVPYFTYRHYYYPKLYDDQVDKKVKMFSKGQ